MIRSVFATALAAAILLATPAGAQVSTVDLLTDAGTQIDGAAANDHSGKVAGDFDFNNDSNRDVLVGSWDASPLGRANAGSASVVLGTLPPLVDLAALGTGGVQIDGEAAGDRTGISVAGAGDVNGDGIGDVIVGADLADPLGRAEAGTAWVIFGDNSGSPIDLAALSTRGFRIDGPVPGGTAGWSVDGAGNVNGDEYDDLIVGVPYNSNAGRSASGSAYVVFGKPDPAPVDLAVLGTGGYPIHGAAADDVAGTSVAGAGNVNGDTLADVIVGAPGADPTAGNEAGSAYVVYGKINTTPVDLAALGSAGYQITGDAPDDNAGYAVDTAGDVNRDGRQDQLVGSPGAGASVEGAANVVYGKASIGKIPTLTPNGYTIEGANPGEAAGYQVAGLGDVSGDLRADQVIGAPDAGNGGRPGSGSAYVTYGLSSAATIFLSSYTSTQGYRIDGPASDAHVGRGVGGAGNAGGDRGRDVIVGAPFNSANGRAASGSSFLVYGVSALRLVPISNFSIRPYSFGSVSVPGSASAAAARGATIRYRLHRPARVRMRIFRELTGRTVGRFREVGGELRERVRCVTGRAARRRGERPCRRHVLVGRLQRTHRRAGAQRMRFGAIIRGRRLRPGRYAIEATARDRSGKTHGPVRARFRVVSR